MHWKKASILAESYGQEAPFRKLHWEVPARAENRLLKGRKESL